MTETDIVIIGAGPIGLELAVALKRAGADYAHLEAGVVGNTIWHWPRRTRFFSNTEVLAIAGVPLEVPGQDRPFGEDYLAYLRSVARQFHLRVRTHERVTRLDRGAGGFRLQTQGLAGEETCRCRRVVLATGDMARPRVLGIPGEDLPGVRHRFLDPHEFFGRRVLIVGGRNSAIEAAIRCHRAGVDVTVSYRRPALDLDRISHKLGPVVEEMIRLGRLAFLGGTVPVAISPGRVKLAPTDDQGRPTGAAAGEHETDFVLILAGYEADTSLFEMAGVTFPRPDGPPAFDPATMESDSPGVYIAGTAAAGPETGHSLFVETCHAHVEKIARALLG